MSTFNKRHTRIDVDALKPRRSHTSQTGEAQSSKSTGKRTATDATLDDPLNARRHGVVYSTSTENRPQLARPQGFPINANGLTKSGDPWHDFEESYGLRFGLDHRVTVAVRKTSPYDTVAIRSFSGAMDNAQVRILQSVRHHNFARTLDVFRAADSTYVLSEHAHVSLHEMSRSRAEITKIELAAILGQVGSWSRFPFAIPVLTFRAGQRAGIPGSPGPRAWVSVKIQHPDYHGRRLEDR
jgi:hypothetical protein